MISLNASPLRSDLLRQARDTVTVTAFCCLIATALALSGRGAWTVQLVYSLAIGWTSFAFISGVWSLLARRDSKFWTHRWRICALVLVGSGVGFVVGYAIGDVYLGEKSIWNLWSSSPIRFTSLICVSLIATVAISYFFFSRGNAEALDQRIAVIEQASAEKTRFLATASHDLRQPMHAIALFSAAMERTLRDHPEGRNAERLMRAVDALGASLDAMLDVSRLDAGAVSASPHAVQLDTLLLSLNQVFLPQAEQKSLQLRVRASSLWVHSDPSLLYRMLSNLLDNALKYTRQGGVTIIARPRGEQVWLEVRDTGIGIASQQFQHIFEEFYQIDNPGRDRARGLGIGLSIVQRLARLLGHTVHVHSRLGRGTFFRLVLQRAEPAGASEPPKLETPPELRSAPVLHGGVLLVDDEAEVRNGVVQLLGAHGIVVEAVASEAEARAALVRRRARDPVVLLMCDYRLAGEDGLDVGQRLRERFAPAAQLLIVTGETSPERLQRVRASGVPVLFKPVRAQTLLHTLAELSPATDA